MGQIGLALQSGRAPDAVQESAENGVCAGFHGPHGRWCLAQDGGSVMRQSGPGQLGVIVRNADPALDQGLVHFQMKLESVGIGAVAEGLVGAGFGPGKALGAVRQGKRAAVPLEHWRPLSELADNWIRPAQCAGLQVIPADFGHGVAADAGSKYVRQQLPAKADAEHGFVLTQGLLDHAELGAQMWPPGLFFHIHWTAEYDQALVAVHAGSGIGLPFKIDEADAMPTLADQRIQRAQRLRCYMLEYDDAGHRTAGYLVGLDIASWAIGVWPSKQEIGYRYSELAERRMEVALETMKSPFSPVCPCDPARTYATCCGRWHAGLSAADAESLMRSRYSAHVLGLSEYLLATWHASTRPHDLDLAVASRSGMRWLGLQVRSARVQDTDHAEVEFIALYRLGGGAAQRLHERSRFVREDDQWFYLDGDQLPSSRPTGRV